MSERKDHLGKPLMRHQSLPSHGVGKNIPGGNGSRIQNVIPDRDVTSQIAIIIEQLGPAKHHAEKDTDK